MALIGFHDIDELKNRNEEKVWAAIEERLGGDATLCRCRDCILDAAAIALNDLKPRYQVYSFHENAPEDEGAVEREVEKAVAKALELVRKRPHHF